jgi:DNA invertase Pin-like site-specific DNA recombinase
VVTKLDRLGRNLLDILVVIQEIEAKGAQLVSIGERFDTTSPMGVAMFQVTGVFAQLERAMIRLRQGRQEALRPGHDPSAVADPSWMRIQQ